jgi:NADH-quinone oxidoreductase subunit J
MEIVLFLFFKFFAILAAIMVVNVRNPVHAILLLILVFINITAILLLLEFEFLALVYLVVYVGAIAVLFLFVVMMLNIKLTELTASELNYLPLNAFILLFLMVEVAFLVYSTFHPSLSPNAQHYVSFISYLDAFSNIEVLGQALFLFYYLPFFLTGFILLLAMIGSIFLTLYHQTNVRRQSITSQILRDYKAVLQNIN